MTVIYFFCLNYVTQKNVGWKIPYACVDRLSIIVVNSKSLSMGSPCKPYGD